MKQHPSLGGPVESGEVLLCERHSDLTGNKKTSGALSVDLKLKRLRSSALVAG